MLLMPVRCRLLSCRRISEVRVYVVVDSSTVVIIDCLSFLRFIGSFFCPFRP